jgi:outer membrane immunogenic protein
MALQQGRIKMSKILHLAMPTGIALVSCLLFSANSKAQDVPRVDMGVDYNYVRTNAPPGGCGCITLHGGDGWVAFNFMPSIALVGQVSGQHASNIEGSGADLTLSSFLVGPRYSFTVTRRIVPFAQVLLGGAHATGSLAPDHIGIAGSSNAFAMTAGGGLDIGLSRHLAIRTAQIDYFMTRFSNGVNDRQNNLRLSAGIVLRF